MKKLPIEKGGAGSGRKKGSGVKINDYQNNPKKLKEHFKKLGGDWDELKEKYKDDVYAEANAILLDYHERNK